MEKYLSDLLQITSNKENIKINYGQQIKISLKDFFLPTVLNKSDCHEFISEFMEDILSPKNEKSFEFRSIYNRQWRFYGADKDGERGVDQFERLCTLIKKKQPDRRLLLAALNPYDSANMSITQCLLQFFIAGDYLSCKVYQSSANLSSIIRYDSCRIALLTYIICNIAGLQPGKLVHSFGNIYSDCSMPKSFEKKFIKVSIHGQFSEIDEFSVDNFILEDGYDCCTDVLDIPYKMNPLKHEEFQYLDLIESILKHGVTLSDRTGVGTRSIFGPQMVFSLQNGILPLITTRRVFYRAIIEELLWFLRGSTNGNELAAKNVHIWDANGSKEFLESCGLCHREVGDLGPVYGFQWRHFGAKYETMHTNYTNMGVDQISNVIKSIMTNPYGTSHLVIAWNPKDLPLMALPPCHCMMQFFVNGDELSCKLYQRAGDMGLGVPFNIASYAILTHIMAHITNLKPGYFIHTLGDAHVYLNHIEPLTKLVQRQPTDFPTLRFARTVNNIEDFVVDDFIVDGYKPHGKIAMAMAV